VSQEKRQIPSRAAARILHTLATVESSAKRLIEQIDVDLAERHSQFGGHRRPIEGHPSMILRDDARRRSGSLQRAAIGRDKATTPLSGARISSPRHLLAIT
jgi:hypothetical protein